MANKWISLDKDQVQFLETLLEATQHGEHILYDDSILTSIKKKVFTTKKTIKIRSAKGKGRSFQQFICQKISDIIKVPYLQSDDNCLIHSREIGQSGSDIIIRGEAKKLFPYSVECKSSESFNFKVTIDQVKANTTSSEDWVIFHRRKAIPCDVAIMDADTFFSLVERGIK